MTSLAPSSAAGRSSRLLLFLRSLLLGFGASSLLWLAGYGLVQFLGAGQVAAFLGLSAKTPWYFSRAAGTVAYLLLTGSTAWGLFLSSKIIREAVPPPLALAMHNTLSWLAVAFTALHGLALLLDNYFKFTPANLLLPFTGPYRPGWVGLGIVGFYLAFLVSLSFNFRRQIGQKVWRRLHRLTFLVYLLGTLHGLMAGTDSQGLGMQLVYAGSGLLVLFLTNYRLLLSWSPRQRSSA